MLVRDWCCLSLRNGVSWDCLVDCVTDEWQLAVSMIHWIWSWKAWTWYLCLPLSCEQSQIPVAVPYISAIASRLQQQSWQWLFWLWIYMCLSDQLALQPCDPKRMVWPLMVYVAHHIARTCFLDNIRCFALIAPCSDRSTGCHMFMPSATSTLHAVAWRICRWVCLHEAYGCICGTLAICIYFKQCNIACFQPVTTARLPTCVTSMRSC